MINYKFDLDTWLPLFPLRPEFSDVYYGGRAVTSPADICNNEHLRKAIRDQVDWGRAVPVDIFVFAEGEPPDPFVTKIGGVPYRPSAKAWPVLSDGQLMTFVGQICFADSFDLTGELPGAVLLVFSGATLELGYDQAFEWEV
jgi:hypothetical protein